jgi:hypothetical protein
MTLNDGGTLMTILMSTSEKITIFIAEDHEIVREGLRALLEREPDFQVIGEAADGRATIKCGTCLLR